MDHTLRNVASHFRILGEYVGSGPYGSGHIHDTYAVAFDQGGVRIRYIFQRVNHNVFKDPVSLMVNIHRVTDHIRTKLAQEGTRHLSRCALTVIPTHEGEDLYRDDDGHYWRSYVFIERARTYDRIESPAQAGMAAEAFGEFQRQLADLPEPRLTETIPDFHNTPVRFKTLEAAIEADVCNRAAGCRAEIDFAMEHRDIANVLVDLQEAGEIPERITHNDTKLNNVMLDDETGEGICVIDLDTVMPGLALYDFGDMVRASTNTAAEDETDLSQVRMDMEMFQALARGYLEAAGDFLVPAEKQYLAFSGKLICFENSIRFLTDHLQGDTYFKIHRENHNLDRCRTQMQMVRSIVEQEDAMNAFVESLG